MADVSKGASGPFDRAAASTALASVDVRHCKTQGGATDSAHVVVTFAPDGHVRSAVVDAGAEGDVSTQGCIVAAFSAVRIPSFDGPAVQVGKRVDLGAEPGTTVTPFDRGAAAKALGAIDIRPCKDPGGPTGAGHLTVTYGNDGEVVSAVVDSGPFPNTSVGGCISKAFKQARVPGFGGPYVRVGKSFVLR